MSGRDRAFIRTLAGPAPLAAVCAALLWPAMPAAEGLSRSAKPPADRFAPAFRLIETRWSSRYGTPDRDLPALKGRESGPYVAAARDAARRHGVPEDLFVRLVEQESGWNHEAVSSKGARGLAQLMPETARDLAVDSDDPAQNLDGGARYLRRMFDRFGSWRLALAAYNAGPEAVARHGGVPPYPETIAYVRAILGS